jgi:DNA-binding CsgD family transcriptional regulator/tetratricopeptide (TPR) repeat protein
VLLERDQELELLADLLGDIDSSGGKVVLLRGEAGIGKSSLVHEFVAMHTDEAHIHVGYCDDLFIPQPLSPFWDMARVEPSLRGPIEDGSRSRLLEEVMDLLSRSLRPTILVIEDTQWADEATLDAVKYLGRRIARTNGLLLLTYRDGVVDYDHPLRKVIGELDPRSVSRISLTNLSPSAVSTLIADSKLDPEEVFAVTRGNPFLVTEMAAAGGERVPSSLQDSVMARVGKLSPEARAMAKTLSAIPEAIPIQDALGLTGATADQLAECEKRGLLDLDGALVWFRHELIRRTVEASLTRSEREAAYRTVLDNLPEYTHPCLLIHCAVEVNDVDRLIDLAPRSARYAAAMGGHRQAVEDFRELADHLDRFEKDARAALLDEWAQEELLVDNISEAIRLNELAFEIYKDADDRKAQSRSLAQAAHLFENLGQRQQAEQVARQAVEVLGSNPDGSDLAGALEANAYLQMMAGNIAGTSQLVEQTLEVAGADIDERIIIRSLNHRGIVANIANYPDGRESLDEARERSEAAGQWFEEGRALLNHAWAAAEFRDLPIAADYTQRAIASAARHELASIESYSTAMYARVLDLEGKWAEAEDLARDLLDAAAIPQMVVLPILGAIEARKGRDTATATLSQAWEMSSVANEFQRLGPAAIAVAEHAWITGIDDLPMKDLKRVLVTGLEHGFTWSTGSLAFWLWKLGELSETPEGIAEPYRLMIEGEPIAAAGIWATIGCPYERAIALAHGDPTAQLEALEILERLGATAVAAKLRKSLRDQGVSVPRGKGRATRSHVAGLTARQAEILQLLDEGLSNTEIADRLFVSPRTVENHVSAVLSKLDSSTREEAVSRARTEGLLAR